MEDIAYSDKNNVYWNCLCDCGSKCVANGGSLRDGAIISCGCIRSKGEVKIKTLLDEYGVKYYQQKAFIACRDRGTLRFDFWLPEYGMCIEFDGIQHYQDVPRWDQSSTLEDRKRRDIIKDTYCQENDILLLRIPYWQQEDIESILKEWLY